MRPQRPRRRSVDPVVWSLLAGISFSVATLSAFGVILSSDVVGRLIFATAWGAIGLAWTGRYLVWRKRTYRKAESPETSEDGEISRACKTIPSFSRCLGVRLEFRRTDGAAGKGDKRRRTGSQERPVHRKRLLACPQDLTIPNEVMV